MEEKAIGQEVLSPGGVERTHEEETGVLTQEEGKRKRAARPAKPFPNYSLRDVLRIPQAIAKNNAGNPWGSDQIATAVSMSNKSSTFYYYTTAARDYGLTTGTSRTKIMELTTLGRKLVYPINPEEKRVALSQAFLNIDIFKKVYDYYGEGSLPEKQYVCNTLQETFGLDAVYHDDFLKIYTDNLKLIGQNVTPSTSSAFEQQKKDTAESTVPDSNQPASGISKKLFVIMPFTEKTGMYPDGYFDEVFSSLIIPAASQAGYTAETANRTGSDIIHKTIVSSIYNAELILADLTEHNPNVLFELGLAIALKKKVAIIRAKGTSAIFDVDHSMRVLDYNSNLWKSTLEMDVSKLSQHLEATAESEETTYLDIFLS